VEGMGRTYSMHGDKTNAYQALVGKREGDPDVGERIILKWIIWK
jgi:hypothetical protein